LSHVPCLAWFQAADAIGLDKRCSDSILGAPPATPVTPAMSMLDRTWDRALAASLWGNSLLDWLEALAVTLLLLLLAALVKRVLRRHFAPPSAPSAPSAPSGRSGTSGVPAAAAAGGGVAGREVALEVVRRTRWWLLLLPAVYLGAQALDLPPRAAAALRSLAILAALLQVALWATLSIDLWVSRERHRRLDADAASATLLGAFKFVLRLVLWVLIGLVALDNLGVNISALVTGLGVGGIAVALALQNILGDILASLSIAIDKPFILGDTIQVDNLVGTVEDVGLKTTRLRSLSGEQLIFANGDLLKSRIHNLKRMADRRVVLTFGVDFQTGADKLEKIPPLLRSVIATQAGVRFDRAHFKGIGQSSLDFEAVYFFPDPDYNLFMDAQQAILLALLRGLAGAEIRLAQPDRTLWVAAETDPPVPRSRGPAPGK
jgi:small-conductance mechanosensitive channel